MSKWEYKTFTSTGGLRIAVEESSSLGEDGWETSRWKSLLS